MTDLYQSSNPGPYEPALTGKFYRAVKLQSNAAAVDLTVTSPSAYAQSNESPAPQPLHLEPGELHTGNTVISDASTPTGVVGYLP